MEPINPERKPVDNLVDLAACANPRLIPPDGDRTARLRRFFETCHQVAETAESHGLAPLLYAYARLADIPLDAEVKTALQALTIRHRRASEARSETLAQIVSAFAEKGIDLLVLKGAALAYTVYAEPRLRPMRDVDILVRQTDAVRAQRALVDLGFAAARIFEVDAGHKHLPPASRRVRDVTISVEVHHDLNEPYMGVKRADFDRLFARRHTFALGGTTTDTLGPTDMLIHLCQHGTYLLEPLKLKWCADVIGVVDRYVEQIDWAALRERAPWVLGTVAMFDCLSPLSARAHERVWGDRATRPTAVGIDFEGWPRAPWSEMKRRGAFRVVGDTLFPGEWWLRLYYGVEPRHSVFWARWVRHPLNVVTWPARVLPAMRDWPVPGWYRTIFWRQ